MIHPSPIVGRWVWVYAALGAGWGLAACGDDAGGAVGDVAAETDALGADVTATATSDTRDDAAPEVGADVSAPDVTVNDAVDEASDSVRFEVEEDVIAVSDGEDAAATEDAAVEAVEDAAIEAVEDGAVDDGAVDDGMVDDGGGEVGQDVVVPECELDEDCDDLLFCNGRERCSGGVCFVSPTVPCTDPFVCTVESCDEDEDRCRVVADDGLCGPGEVCKLKVGCFRTSGCVRDADCDDGLACNGVETCAAGVCAPGAPAECDDLVACTRDECVEEEGGCQHVPVHGDCLPTELCHVALGCTDRPPCDDADDCDDASFCNGVETCDGDSGTCAPGVAPVVADLVACTVDQCSEERATVTHTPSPQRCTNGLYCDGAEVCHPVAGCQPGAPPVLSDGVGCTVDRCDEAADFIEHVADAALCDDGLFCNGEEVCHPLDGCGLGEPPVLSDGVGCTFDTCSEVQGQVLHVPRADLCDDALACNGVEACDVSEGCVGGEAPVVDDGIACTLDACDEGSGVVTHTPRSAMCADADPCNGVEVCHATLGCQAGAAALDGVVCGAAPRAICLDGVCGESVCGDGYTDTALGEACDDGNDDEDACTSACQPPAIGGYGGAWDIVPDLAYTCAQGLVSYDIDDVTLTIDGAAVSVSGSPRAPGTLSGTLVGPSFTATVVLLASDFLGGCDETYTIAGTFDSEAHWSGTFTRRFDVRPGLFAGCGNCSNASTPIEGTR